MLASTLACSVMPLSSRLRTTGSNSPYQAALFCRARNSNTLNTPSLASGPKIQREKQRDVGGVHQLSLHKLLSHGLLVMIHGTRPHPCVAPRWRSTAAQKQGVPQLPQARPGITQISRPLAAQVGQRTPGSWGGEVSSSPSVLDAGTTQHSPVDLGCLGSTGARGSGPATEASEGAEGAEGPGRQRPRGWCTAEP